MLVPLSQISEKLDRFSCAQKIWLNQDPHVVIMFWQMLSQSVANGYVTVAQDIAT